MANEPQGYITKEANSILPKLNINKVIVSENNVRCVCSLDRDTNLNYDSWLGSSEFMKYLNFYFIVSGKLHSTNMSKFYFAKTRASALSSVEGDPSSWENSVLKFSGDSRRPEFRIKGATKVNINDIFQGNYFIKNENTPEYFQPLSAGDIEDISANDLSSGDNTYFEVDIPMAKGWSDISEIYNLRELEDGVDLLAFAQLDIKSLSDEYGLGQFVGRLAEYGGPLVYQRLLRLSSFASGEERYWTVPETISAFFDESGKPYSGPAHYHEGIGYMSGPSFGSMNGRKRLTKRQIPNNKVISKIFMERELDANGNVIRTARDRRGNEVVSASNNRFVGYTNPLAVTQNTFLSPYGNLSFGDDLLATLKSEIGLSKLSETAQALQRDQDQQQEVSRMKMKQMVFSALKNSDSFLGPSQDEYTDLVLVDPVIESYYKILFPINFENLVKLNSNYGHAIDFHRDVLSGKKKESQINKSYFTPEGESYWFIKGCLDRSIIADLRFTRHRVSNSPYSNNKLGTATYSTKDRNEVAQALTTTGNLPKASINLVKNSYSENGWTNIFELRDHDLFRNYSHGKYQYSLEVVVADGIKSNLKRLYRQFSNSVKAFSDYVVNASRPYISNPYIGFKVDRLFQTARPTPRAVDRISVSGNYDYEKQRFTRDFIDRQSDFESIVEDVVINYIRVVYILTKRDSLMSREKKEQLVRFLLPSAGDIGNLNMFLDLCSRLETSFKNKLFLRGESIEDTINYGTFKRSPKSAREYPDNVMFIKSDMPGITVNTCSKNSVFFEIDSEALQDGIATNESVPASGFFSLTQETLSNEILRNDTRPNRVEYSPNGDLIGKSLLDFAKTNITSAPGESFSGALIAALEDSLSREVYDEASESSSDPLKVMNSLLSSFGGVSFGYLLSKTLDVSDTGRSKCRDILNEDGQVSKDVQQVIASAIQTSTDKSMFLREVEESYKNNYFTKRSLGSLFDFVGTALASKRRTEKVKKNLNYKELVLAGKSKKQIKQENTPEENILDQTKFDIYEMDSSGVFVPLGTSDKDTLGIYKAKPKNTLPMKNGSKLVAVNTITTDSNRQRNINRRL